MKRVGYTTNQSGERVTLAEAMADYANVQKAYNKARKCKRYRKDVLIFTKDKEGNLEEVRDDILNRSARAGKSQKSSYKRVYRAGRDTQDTPTATTYGRK